MLLVVLLTLAVVQLSSQQFFTEFKEIVGIDKNGETYVYNGLITKHWVKTQGDELKIKKADVNPDDGYIYAVELGSAVVYRKQSFDDHQFTYVDCCSTTFTFVDTPITGLPTNIKLLRIDGRNLFALRYFADRYLSFEIDVDVVDISSVGGVVVALDKLGRLYELKMHKGQISFVDVTSSFGDKLDKLTSISAWRAQGKFLGTSESGEVWMSWKELGGWDSYGSGRSCCVISVFEVPQIESFAEQSYPFCTQSNLQRFHMSQNGNCLVADYAFGLKIYNIMDDIDRPCLEYMPSTTIQQTSQDLLSDYKIVIKAVYESPGSLIGVAFNFRDEEHFDYVYIDPANRNDCWRMGHMTTTGSVDRANLNTGCPGGPPIPGQTFILEVQTVERQVIVKLDGFSIFSRYPHYDNMAAGGLITWARTWDTSSVQTYGIGICYVPNEDAYEFNSNEAVDKLITPDYTTAGAIHTPNPTDPGFIYTEEFSTPGADVTESLREVSSPFTTSSPPITINNVIDGSKKGDNYDASTELISSGVHYTYYLFSKPTGFTAANSACDKEEMDMLIIDDEIQNARVAQMLKENFVSKVWLGKFWIYEWTITLNTGDFLDWDNFQEKPKSSDAGVFAVLRDDGYWDSVPGKERYPFVCQKAEMVDMKDKPEVNDVRNLQDPDDDVSPSIMPCVENDCSMDHPPAIIKGPVNVTAKVGDTVTFKCTASSRPPSTVIIVKMDREDVDLPSKGDPGQLNDESQRVTTIIELESVTIEDAGKYTCIAQNELGEASESAWLIIEELDNLEIPKPTCMLWGDPHIESYDGTLYDFPGRCTYILSMDCTSSSFWIYGLMKECGGSNIQGPSLSALDSVTIYARVSDGNQTGVELQRGWVVNIGGAKLRISEGMSARHGNLIIRRTSEHVFVTLPNKVSVQWDGLQMAVIRLPENFGLDKTCGLCGRYNNNPDDDFYMRYGHTDITTNANEFGNSWAFPTHFRPCDSVPLEEVDPCDSYPDRRTEGSIQCQQNLYQVPFTTCHTEVDPTAYYENCVRDYCGSEWRRDQNLPLCNALSAYATACDLKGRPITSWRSVELCPIDEIKEITKEEGCPWDELEFDFDTTDGERDTLDS